MHNFSLPVKMKRWIMQNNFKPEIDFEFTFKITPQKGWDRITHCKVTEIEPLKTCLYF